MLAGEGRVLVVPDRAQQEMGRDSWLGSGLLE